MNADILGFDSRIKQADEIAPCEAPCRRYELRFRSLFDSHRGLSFPCNQCGEVHIDGLKPQERRNYFFARALVGHDFAQPVVSVCG